MEIAGEILHESWENFGGQDEHWRLAALEIATGEPGIEGEFAEKFDLAFAQAQEIMQRDPHFLQNPPSSETTNMARSPNIYDRASSNPLLIFSK